MSNALWRWVNLPVFCAVALVGIFAGRGARASEHAPVFGPMADPDVDVVEYVLPRVGETERPPLGMTGSVRAVVEYVPPSLVAGACSGATVSPGAVGEPLACTRVGEVPVVRLPNPCSFPWDPYAALACHELGHVNGWVHREDGA